MSQRRFFLRMAAAGAVLLLVVSEALACACCSDPGEYGTRTADAGSSAFSQIGSMEFGPKAQLFMTDAGEEQVKGVSPVSDSYALAAAVTGKAWRLRFRGDDGKTGVLTLPLPARMTSFAADIRDGAKSAGGGPLLYKEWRFAGTATGTGIFVKGPMNYTLTFQGRGNRCDNPGDFGHWRLDMKGKGVDFSFFGDLKSGTR